MNKWDVFGGGLVVGMVAAFVVMLTVFAIGGVFDRPADRYTVAELEQAIATREAMIATQVAELEESR